MRKGQSGSARCVMWCAKGTETWQEVRFVESLTGMGDENGDVARYVMDSMDGWEIVVKTEVVALVLHVSPFEVDRRNNGR